MIFLERDRFHQMTEHHWASLHPILVVGDLGIDKYTCGEVSRISPEAPVPVLSVRREWEKLGLAANIAHNLQTLEIPTLLCGLVGADSRGRDFEGLLLESGLKSEGLIRTPARPTILKERITTSTQQICRVDYEVTSSLDEALENQLIAQVEKSLRDCRGVILQDYGKGTLTQRVIGEIITLAKGANHMVAIDPSTLSPPHFYKGATLLKPNLKEARGMVESMGYGPRDLPEMATILMDELEVEKLVITLGAEGMALFDGRDNRGLCRVPTMAQEVFDVSGAGDTAMGLLVTTLLGGGTLKEAAWLANCGAGVVVAKRGTATVNKRELTAFYHKVAATCEKD